MRKRILCIFIVIVVSFAGCMLEEEAASIGDEGFLDDFLVVEEDNEDEDSYEIDDPPFEYVPPIDEPPFEEDPPFDEEPPIEGDPPIEEEPPFEDVPPIDEPPFEEEPPFEGEPPFEEEPPFGEESPIEEDPPFEEEPPFEDNLSPGEPEPGFPSMRTIISEFIQANANLLATSPGEIPSPTGFHYFYPTMGDLNGNGAEDFAIVFYEHNFSVTPNDPDLGPGHLFIVLAQADGNYEIAFHSDSIIAHGNAWTWGGDSFWGMKIENGTLTVSHVNDSGIITANYVLTDDGLELRQ